MEAVAQELGVDRKTLHYHVGDRVALLHAVAEDLFLEGFGAEERDTVSDWREALRSLAFSVIQAYLSAGSFSPYVPLAGEVARVRLLNAERTLETLVEAGLDETAAGRSLALLTAYAYGVAMELLLETTNDNHPQMRELQRVIPGHAGGLPVLSRVLADRTSFRDRADVEFAIDLIIAGIESALPLTAPHK